MGYCISVCIEKGGVGKTVTVCNLAALMAQDGKRVLVVDMDARGIKYAESDIRHA